MTSTLARPSAGTIDDIRREDDCGGHDGRGYERDETDQFHQLVGRLVADGGDRAWVAGRRTRRTRTEMRARINIAARNACQSCGGTGGQVVDTSSDGVSRQHWQTCQACGGSGVAR
jgi:hypothetical protein